MQGKKSLGKVKGGKGKVSEWYLPFPNETTNVSSNQ